MLNISQVILMRTDSNLCRKELTVHWSAPNSLIGSYLQPCTNSMWGDESEAVAPIIWLYQIVDAQKEEVFFPELLITLRSYEGFCQIHARHDMLGCQCRHEFSESNAWIAWNDVPPKVFHWPLYTGWSLGWYRMLPMPIAIQRCECCPVVVNWYSMLCHPQCNRSTAWSVQWPGTASEVCLCPLPTSSKRPLG